WARGLPLLAKGSDTTLASLASKDQEVGNDAEAQADMGELWFQRAAKETSPGYKERARERARYWFWKALPRLADASRDRVETRLKLTAGNFSARPGLVMEVFKDDNLNKKVKGRIDYQPNFNWGMSPPDPAVSGDDFSIRWKGWLMAPEPGEWMLTMHTEG